MIHFIAREDAVLHGLLLRCCYKVINDDDDEDYYYYYYYHHNLNALALVDVIPTLHQGREPYPSPSPFQHPSLKFLLFPTKLFSAAVSS